MGTPQMRRRVSGAGSHYLTDVYGWVETGTHVHHDVRAEDLTKKKANTECEITGCCVVHLLNSHDDGASNLLRTQLNMSLGETCRVPKSISEVHCCKYEAVLNTVWHMCPRAFT